MQERTESFHDFFYRKESTVSEIKAGERRSSGEKSGNVEKDEEETEIRRGERREPMNPPIHGSRPKRRGYCDALRLRFREFRMARLRPLSAEGFTFPTETASCSRLQGGHSRNA